jgi:hypothetical protein
MKEVRVFPVNSRDTGTDPAQHFIWDRALPSGDVGSRYVLLALPTDEHGFLPA